MQDSTREELFMQVNERVFVQKMMTFSKSTIHKISILSNSSERLRKIYSIVMESKKEQEVMEKLNTL